MARTLAYFVIALCVLPSFGCNILSTGYWIINPNDVDAEYSGLANQRVAVVCRPDTSLTFQSRDVVSEIAFRVNKELGKNVSRIDVVNQTEVNDWMDQSEFTSYVDLGRKLGADLVVAIELEDFTLHKGKTMLQGQATATINIIDVASGKIDDQLMPVESLYPPRSGIPVDMTDSRFENRFRRKYVSVLANQIARRFYDHDSRTALGIDRFYRED